MTAKTINTIHPQLSKMLESLSGVPGYEQFVEWLGTRAPDDASWGVEIRAMFEVNKPAHPLIRICSQETGAPEALFRFAGTSSVGFLECALIEYLFDSNHEKERCLNIVMNEFASIRRHLKTNQGSFVLIISDVRQAPTRAERDVILRAFERGIPQEMLHEAPFGFYGYYQNVLDRQQIELQMNGRSLFVVLSRTGTASGGHDVDLNAKIERLISAKRSQHKDLVATHFPLYYFMIAGPPTCLNRIDRMRLLERLRPYESLVCTTGGTSVDKLFENKILFTNRWMSFDLSNPLLGKSE